MGGGGGGGKGNGSGQQQQSQQAADGATESTSSFQRGLDSGLAKAAPSAVGLGRTAGGWNFSAGNVYRAARRQLWKVHIW